MKITIGGSLGNIGKPLTQKLVTAGHKVTVISSQPARQQEIESLGAKAAIGFVNDAAFLTSALAGADAVFAMTPPNLGGSNVIVNTVNAGAAYATAIRKADVKRVVMLSSIGAHLPDGNGPIAAIHQIEKIYQQLPDVSVTFLRAGYFYNNFYHDIPMIRNAGIEGSNFSFSTLMPLVHPKDIATAAAGELIGMPAGKHVRYIVGDLRMGVDIAKVLGAAIAKPELPWVEFSDEQAIQGMMQAGVPEEIAHLYAEMGAGFRKGTIIEDFERQGAPVTGAIRLEEFAKEFASKFKI
ncbi:MAG TPA: NAD(P)H-binding protein [Chryseolinea sp.]|nr:NAD(P)H-binding protein [Chryseolinea sp.]